jgi:hypothetical protein
MSARGMHPNRANTADHRWGLFTLNNRLIGTARTKIQLQVDVLCGRLPLTPCTAMVMRRL